MVHPVSLTCIGSSLALAIVGWFRIRAPILHLGDQTGINLQLLLLSQLPHLDPERTEPNIGTGSVTQQGWARPQESEGTRREGTGSVTQKVTLRARPPETGGIV